MRPAKLREHFARVRGVARLSKDFAVQLDSRVRAHDNDSRAWSRPFAPQRRGFYFREARNHGARSLAWKFRLVNCERRRFQTRFPHRAKFPRGEEMRTQESFSYSE